MEHLRTDSFPILNTKRRYSTLRSFKTRKTPNLGKTFQVFFRNGTCFFPANTDLVPSLQSRFFLHLEIYSLVAIKNLVLIGPFVYKSI